MLNVIILAAGKGTRMVSEKPKVLFEVAGEVMLDYSIELARKLNPAKIIVVVGNCADEVMNHAKNDDIIFATQIEQKGTADAVSVALPYINDGGKVLITCGDMPLMQIETIEKFIESSKADINFISVKSQNPKGYGRVLKSPNGNVIKIVEEKDANENEKHINEINTGVYFCEASMLKSRLIGVKNDNAQKEYYLTDIVKQGASVFLADDEEEFLGINDRTQLATASKVLWKRRATDFMKSGVTITDPDNFYVGKSVKIGSDTIIYPNVTLSGKTIIGKSCIIMSGSRIVNSNIEDKCEIRDNCLIDDAIVGELSSVGPMAHLRPQTILLGNNRIGNFVETKKSTIGYGSKASHLTYLGDATLGEDVNIGCGTITCNYDGKNKHKTIIGDRVFVGSDVQFVAPINVGDDALIGAGTTVTKDVPAKSLAIARTKQTNIEKYCRTY